MVHFIGFVIYIFSLVISIAAEVRTIANPGGNGPRETGSMQLWSCSCFS